MIIIIIVTTTTSVCPPQKSNFFLKFHSAAQGKMGVYRITKFTKPGVHHVKGERLKEQNDFWRLCVHHEQRGGYVRDEMFPTKRTALACARRIFRDDPSACIHVLPLPDVIGA